MPGRPGMRAKQRSLTVEHDTPEHQPAPRCACNFSAEEVASAIIDKIKDPKTAEEVMAVWGGQIDQQLGRGMRRLGLYVILGLLSAGAVKLGLLEKLFSR